MVLRDAENKLLKMPASKKDDRSSLLITVPCGITTSAALIDFIAREMSFPKGYGKNWNALFDCLCDLGWVRERLVVIDHASIPDIGEEDLSEYYDVLRKAQESWECDPGDHELIVKFPKVDEATP